MSVNTVAVELAVFVNTEYESSKGIELAATPELISVGG
jgi:hypothetical protein